MCIPYFLYSSIGGHLGCVHILENVNSSAININMQITQDYDFNFGGYMSRSEIAGPYSNFTFKF